MHELGIVFHIIDTVEQVGRAERGNAGALRYAGCGSGVRN